MRNRVVIAGVLGSLVGTAHAEYKKLPKQPKLASNQTIPSGERSADNLVVTGKGFRFQVKPDAVAVDVGGGTTGYLFGDTGFDGSSSAIVMWATKTPFKGDLEALMKRESDAARKAGAKVDADGLFFESGGMNIEGKYSLRGGQRAQVTIGDKTELRLIHVHEKAAYVWHCQSPAEAWRNTKSTCLVLSTTFHVEPKK